MTSHLSERFHDSERRDVYLDLIQSSLDRPLGGEQAWLLDSASSPSPRPAAARSALPRVSFRWLTLPRLPVPFLSWAS